MTSVASSPHTTSFLLCASIVNGTPWARKKILDRNGLGSNFFFVANEDSLGDSAWPGRESLVPPSPPHCIFPFTRSSGGASWSSAKHSTEKSWSLQVSRADCSSRLLVMHRLHWLEGVVGVGLTTRSSFFDHVRSP